jgi:hypothetical protein
MPGVYPLSDDSRDCSLITACTEQPVAHAITHDDTILKIDEAVGTMVEIQREALRSGKVITVEIKEPEEMAEWLKIRDAGVASSAGSKRCISSRANK